MDMQTRLLSICQLLATFFYVGKIPVAPGTFGSVAGAAFFMLVRYWSPDVVVLSGVALILVAAGVFSSDVMEKASGENDPREIVIDEAAGMFLALLFVTRFSAGGVVAAFALFRLLDITKPLFIGRLERLRGGWGIMADDLAAGLAAGILCLSGEILLRSAGWL